MTFEPRVLHVTNGDSAVNALRSAGFRGDFLPWRDVLHDGPVPAGLSNGELAAVRATFIAESGWDSFEHALTSFRERDQQLERLAAFDEVVLWFEHDLYDQLQLIQVLDRFAPGGAVAERLTMTVEADFISMMAAEGLRRLYVDRRPVGDPECAAASRAWDAFRMPDPTTLAGLSESDLAVLPFLHGAIGRLLEEYPAPGSGISRTEEQILEAVNSGAATPGQAFRACHNREDAAFMGDASFWRHVRRLLVGVQPLLAWVQNPPPEFPPATFRDRRFLDQELEVTPSGRAALEGRFDHVGTNGSRRWIGGVLQQPGRLWRYDRVERRLLVPAGNERIP